MAHIAVVNPTSTVSLPPPDGMNTSGGYVGLETERICELVVSGATDCVDVARVRLLVMLDELVRFYRVSGLLQISYRGQSGLHAEACEIDHKLHAIIASRKRSVIQSIQEETATNIYFPAVLQGHVGPACPPLDPAPSPQGSGSPRQNCNVIWITGEFFGVQRARDTLVQVSLLKASIYPVRIVFSTERLRSCSRRRSSPVTRR